METIFPKIQKSFPQKCEKSFSLTLFERRIATRAFRKKADGNMGSGLQYCDFEQVWCERGGPGNLFEMGIEGK